VARWAISISISLDLVLGECAHPHQDLLRRSQLGECLLDHLLVLLLRDPLDAEQVVLERFGGPPGDHRHR
jgi:hypothetical protein